MTQEKLISDRYRLIGQTDASIYEPLIIAEDTKDDNNKVFLKFLPRAVLESHRSYESVKAALDDFLTLDNPNIEKPVTLDETDYPFIVSPYFEGETLETLIDSDWKPSPDEICNWLRPVAEAIDYAHSKGIVHGDLRPSLILVNENAIPMICDFAISRAIRNGVLYHRDQLNFGGLAYTSPEQLLGAAPSPGQDIYSFAAIAYECLTGHPPFYRGQIEYQIANVRPVPLKHGTAFTKAIMAALSKDPAKRPPSCKAILEFGNAPAEKPAVTPKSVQQKTELPRKQQLTISNREKKLPSNPVIKTNPTEIASQKSTVAGPPSSEETATPQNMKKELRHHHRRNDGDDDIRGSDLLYRLQREPLVQAMALGIVNIIGALCALIFFANKPDNSQFSNFSFNEIENYKSDSSYAADITHFGGIEFGREFARFPVIGEKLDFGTVKSVGYGKKNFEVKFNEKLFKFFDTGRINLVGANPDGSGSRIASIRITKEANEGVDKENAEQAMKKITELTADELGIKIYEPVADESGAFFSTKYSDGKIDVRIACATSEHSTTFFVQVDNLTVK